jgi:hypothetical protein
MFLKKRAESWKESMLLLLIAMVISATSIRPTSFKQTCLALHDHFMGYDLGFSSASPGLARRFRGAPLELIRKAPDVVSGLLLGHKKRPMIGRMELHIGAMEFQSILSDRGKALRAGVLSGAQEVDGRVQINGKLMCANIRLKGGQPDHWRGRDRMSLRVEIRGPGTVLGYKRFAIHKPESRQHPHDHTFQKLMRDAGNLASAQQYIHVKVNGADWGIMNMEEMVSKEFLEKQGRRDSIVFQFPGMNIGSVYSDRQFDPALNLDIVQQNRYLSGNNNFRRLLSFVVAKKQSTNNLALFDVDSYSRALILARIWGSEHALAAANSKHYLNPYTLKLEIITTDQGPFKDITSGNAFPVDSLFRQLVNCPQFKKREPINFASVAESARKSQGVVDQIQNYFPLDRPVSMDVVSSNLKFLESVETGRVGCLRKAINTGQPRQEAREPNPEFRKHVSAFHFSDGTIAIHNLLQKPVMISEIKMQGKLISLPRQIIPPYISGQYKPALTIATQVTGIRDGQLRVRTVCEESTIEHPVHPTLYVNDIHNPLDATDQPSSAVIQRGEDGWRIQKGDWVIRAPVVLNDKLTIEAGTRIRFSQNAYLAVKGAIIARGTAGEPIELGPVGSGWKGIYCFQASEESYLRHVTIKQTTGLVDGVLSLTGGVTFYRSDVSIDHCKFIVCGAEDALNIVHSRFNITKVVVRGTRSDAIDFDFANGIVMDSVFSQIRGDALDFSGSRARVVGAVFTDVRDKALSAGEQSVLVVKNCDASNIGVGIASKDGSKTTCVKFAVDDFSLYAAMAYNKKDFYPSASLDIRESRISSQSEPFICELGAFMSVDKKVVPPRLLDVRAMYAKGAMKK